MKVLFLGTGTSTGIPQIGCNCFTCQSTDPADKRLRASVLIEDQGTKVLIDCGPDLRQQFIHHNIKDLSGILLTHEHYDHVGGLDDVRPLGNVNVYAEDRVLRVIQRNMPYCFAENKYPGVPKIELRQITEEQFTIGHLEIRPIRALHAKLPIFGYRIGNMAYLTDVKTIEKKSIEQLKGVELLILNALRHQSHLSHLTLEEALEIVEVVNPQQAYLTHMSHDMGRHRDVNANLPHNIQLAYDGQLIELFT